MGITELEVIAFMVSGAVLVAGLYTEDVKLTLKAILMICGLVLLIFGVLDVFIDHQ